VSILAGAQQKIVVPVSCVEQGRRHYRSCRFASAGGALFAINGGIATHSLRPLGRRAGDEGALNTDVFAPRVSQAVTRYLLPPRGGWPGWGGLSRLGWPVRVGQLQADSLAMSGGLKFVGAVGALPMGLLQEASLTVTDRW